MSKTPENRSKVTFIYTLADPVTKEVRLENLGDIKPNLKGTTNKKIVSFNGEQRLFMELCKEFNINYQTLRSRLNKGMTIEEAISKEVRSKRTNMV